MWELSARQGVNIIVFVTPFTLSSLNANSMIHIFSVLCGACQEHRRVTTALQLSTQAAPTNCSSKLPEKTQKNATRHVNTVVMGWTSLANPDPTFRLTWSSRLDFLIVFGWGTKVYVQNQSGPSNSILHRFCLSGWSTLTSQDYNPSSVVYVSKLIEAIWQYLLSS